MKAFMACLILGLFVGLIPPPSSAQQNQSSQYSVQEFETLKKRVSELEKQLQTVENVEKMELQAKLAETNAKLLNSEFGKFKRELKDSNDEWLGKWSERFVITLLSIIGVAVTILLGVGAIFWFWLRSTSNQLIADRVERNLNGFREALKDLHIVKNQLKVLETAHTVSTLGLDSVIYSYLLNEGAHPESLKVLREEVLLDIFRDEGSIQGIRDQAKIKIIRYKAVEVLAARKSSKLVSPLLEFLNSVVDSDSDIDFGKYSSRHSSAPFVNLLGEIHTDETCKGLREFLSRLYSSNQKQRDMFLTWTVLSLAKVSIKLNRIGSASLLRKSIPDLQVSTNEHMESHLESLATYLDVFNEPDGIKELLTTHGQSLRSHVVDKCLELLQKHDPEFVENWRSQSRTDDTDSAYGG